MVKHIGSSYEHYVKKLGREAMLTTPKNQGNGAHPTTRLWRNYVQVWMGFF
jgi:hypothetical protein